MGTVALIRGAGMVVKHHEVRPSGAFEGFGVLLAGNACFEGEQGPNDALEEFTRACEPPAHHDWKGEQRKAKATYWTKPPSPTPTSTLAALWASISKALIPPDEAPDVEGAQGPQDLREFFRLGGKNKVASPKKFSLEILSHKATDRFQVRATYGRMKTANPPTADLWRFTVSLEIAQDGSGRNEPIPLESVTPLPEGSSQVKAVDMGDGTFDLILPGEMERVEFTALSKAPPFQHAAITEVVARLNVSTEETGE